MASPVISQQQESSTFIRDTAGAILPTVENFYQYCAARKLMGIRCTNCQTIFCPPRSICKSCMKDKFEWIEFEGRGKLLTYTVIHFAPSQFQALAPYGVGILKLDEGPQLPGMVKNIKLEDLRVGMRLQVDFETAIHKEWPRWPRYFFKPPY